MRSSVLILPNAAQSVKAIMGIIASFLELELKENGKRADKKGKTPVLLERKIKFIKKKIIEQLEIYVDRMCYYEQIRHMALL